MGCSEDSRKMKEFFWLVAYFLQFRWEAFHVEGSDKMFLFIGEMDYQAEMYLLLKEIKQNDYHS